MAVSKAANRASPAKSSRAERSRYRLTAIPREGVGTEMNCSATHSIQPASSCFLPGIFTDLRNKIIVPMTRAAIIPIWTKARIKCNPE